MAKIDVYGLTDEQCSQLRNVALQRFGKGSVSLLAKNILLEVIQTEFTPIVLEGSLVDKKRIPIRLVSKDYDYLKKYAARHGITPNMMAVSIIRSYITKHPNLSAKEIEVLYQSNGQLLRIGRNINQIARQLNAMEGVNLTSDHIAKLHTFIDDHTKKVGDVLLANRRRFG